MEMHTPESMRRIHGIDSRASSRRTLARRLGRAIHSAVRTGSNVLRSRGDIAYLMKLGKIGQGQ